MAEAVLYFNTSTGLLSRNNSPQAVDQYIPDTKVFGIGDDSDYAMSFDGTNTTVTQTGGNVTHVLTGSSAAHRVKLGDAAGVSLFEIHDSAAVQVARIDSDGNTQMDGKLTVSGTAESTIAGSFRVSGNLFVDGTTTTISSETVLNSDNYLGLNSGYTAVSAQSAGLVAVILPTATSTTTAGAGVFVAAVASVSDATVTTAGSATFSVGQIIQISGSVANDGLYEVVGHVGTLLTIRSLGLTAPVEDFSQNQFTAHAGDTGAAIRWVNVSAFGPSSSGTLRQAYGNTTPLTYSTLAVSGDSGWVDDGAIVRLSTAADEVVAGQATTVSSKLGAVGTTASNKVLVARAHSAQSANTVEFQTSAGTAFFSLGSTGVMTATQNVDLTATGGSSGSANVDISGYFQVAGATELDGTLQVDAAATFNDNVMINGSATTIGNAATDTIEFQARLATSTNLIPISNNSSKLGTTSLGFSEIWLKEVDTTTARNLGGTGAGASGASTIGVDGAAFSYLSTSNNDVQQTLVSVDAALTAIDFFDRTSGVITTQVGGDSLVIGGGTPADIAQLGSVGVSDQRQLAARGFSTQLTDIFALSNSAATDLFTVSTSVATFKNVQARINDNQTLHIGTGDDWDIVSDGTDVTAAAASNLVISASNKLDLGGTQVRGYITVTTTGTAVGDIVYVSAANAVSKALANASATSRVLGVTMATGKVATFGLVSVKLTDNAGFGAAAFFGKLVYLSTTGSGGGVTAVPTGAGNFRTLIGVIVSPASWAANGDLVLVSLAGVDFPFAL